MKPENILRSRSIGIRGLAVLSIAVLSLAALSSAQSGRCSSGRCCSVLANRTPGAGADTACLDLLRLDTSSTPYQTASNATRISDGGLNLCQNAFRGSGGVSEADIVFIIDNSGSMWSSRAYVNGTDTTYYSSCNGSSGSVTYRVAEDIWDRTPAILNRTIPSPTNQPTSCTVAGDPYNARGSVVDQAIDYLVSVAPTSTAGVVGFADVTMNPQSPLVLNVPANVTQVKSMVRLDSVGGTNYDNPLTLAKAWLNDTSITRTQTQAIVFISDGAPNPSGANGRALVDANMPPIYSIYLARTSTPDTANLKWLSDTTQGEFFRVDPSNPAAIQTVMDSIVRRIVSTSVPRTITITNSTAGQTSVANTMNLDSNGNLSVTLDSIIALRQGPNLITVTVTKSDSTVNTYTFSINADGPVASVSTGDLYCYNLPTLELRDGSGAVVTQYTYNATSYNVRLVRYGDDSLNSVTVSAITRDSMPPIAPGDNEDIALPLNGTSGNTATYQGPTPFNGADQSPSANNGTLEADANGKIILTWTHPLDPSEFAVDTVYGYKIPVITGTVVIDRKLPVGGGAPPSGPIISPVVVLAGSACLYNCNNPAEVAARDTLIPAFRLTTRSPFNFSVHIYDHLGQFVNKAGGGVDSAQWDQARVNSGTDSVVSELKILPVSHDGRAYGTGVYVLKVTIQTQTLNRVNAGVETRVTSAKRRFINKFGYVHP